ncbi:UDP-N-acetylmuramate--L-alanine ligase [Bacteroidota bacterium]
MGENRIGSVYFLGIGGIGMSALARYFMQQGARVSGYDKTPSALTHQLIGEGMNIHFTEDPSLIPEDVDLAVWTPAIPKEHPEYRHLLERGIQVKKRAEVLGEIASRFTTIAVAGTHGKTTTSTMIAHLFHTAGKSMLAFLGGISNNYETNFVRSEVRSQESEVRNQDSLSSLHPFIPSSPHHHITIPPYHHTTTCIVEADEFDRSFLQLSPDIAIITSMDADHLDIYNHKDHLKHSFGDFAERIRQHGSLIIKKGIDLDRKLPEPVSRFTYALEGAADFTASSISIQDGLIHFDLVTPDKTIPGFVLGMPGMFNLENAIAALAAAWISGIPESVLKQAMQDFSGVVRRFDIRIKRDDFIYIDDYAHHPEELHACIHAVKELFPGKKVTGIFQPHLYSRTRDLADDFARVLAELDALILLDIYPAREKPIEGVDSTMLLDKTDLADKVLCDKGELLQILDKRHPEILLTLGAGDIDQLVKPITDHFAKETDSLKTIADHKENGPEQ